MPAFARLENAVTNQESVSVKDSPMAHPGFIACPEDRGRKDGAKAPVAAWIAMSMTTWGLTIAGRRLLRSDGEDFTAWKLRITPVPIRCYSPEERG